MDNNMNNSEPNVQQENQEPTAANQESPEFCSK